MGVPKFYRWLSERYPLINQLISNAAVLPEIDNFYLDMNGIIHACTHPNSDFLANSLTVREMMLSIFRYINRMVTEIVKPKKLLFMAIDGVAPRAKLNQQRARRFCAAQGRTEAIDQAKARGEAVDEDTLFDSNCITPGTEFMETVSRHLKYFIRKQMKEDPLWRDLTIIFSGHDVPGEGEHKIMSFIRDLRSDPNYEPNIRHCMYGQDADLIMLGLATHEPHFTLLREVINFKVGGPGKKSAREVVMRQSKDAQFQLLHLSLLRQYLLLDFGMDAPSGTIDGERIIDDFIFLTFLVGNDFLPHLPTLDISEHAFDVLLNAYRQLFKENPGYIVDKGEIGDYKRLEALFQIIGSQEFDILAKREVEVKETNNRRRKHAGNEMPTEEELDEADAIMQQAYENALKEAMGLPVDATQPLEAIDDTEVHEQDFSLEAISAATASAAVSKLTFDSPEEAAEEEKETKVQKNYRGRYYFEKFHLLVDCQHGDKFLTDLMRHYLKGLLWCLAYYIKGCVSWTWYFPYHYGPLLQDMRNLSVLQSEISFELGQPFTPYQQLLGCLPPASSRLVPGCYRHLMTNKDSPVIHFYPSTFKVDQDGKKNPWEAVVLLDFIDEDQLRSAEAQHCTVDRLSRAEIGRNKFGRILMYHFDPNVTETLLSCNPEIGLPDIQRCMSVVQEVPFSLSPGHYFASQLVPGTISPIAGFPTLGCVKMSTLSLDSIKVNIFGSASRYRSLCLTVDNPIVAPLTSQQAQMLLNRNVFVNYPHMHEAKIVAVSTEVEEIRLCENPPKTVNPIDALNTMGTKQEKATSGTTSSEVFNGVETIRAERLVYDHYATQEWLKASAAEETKYLNGRCVPGSGGLVIGKVITRLRVRPLQGLQRDPVTGVTTKVFSKELEADIPIQLVLWEPPVKDDRFAESGEMKIDELFPTGASVVAVSGKLIGCKGSVLRAHTSMTKPTANMPSLKKKLVDVEFSIPQPEPPFGYALAKSLSDQYFNSKDLCSLLRISPSVLGKITGSLRMEPGRIDLGLNLKRKGMYQLLGYVRKRAQSPYQSGGATRAAWTGIESVHIVGMAESSSAENDRLAEMESVWWEYSQHAAMLLCEYKSRFPLLFQQLEALPHTPVYDPKDMFGSNSSSYVAAVMEWMKSQSFFDMPRTPMNTESLSRDAMSAIERASDVHATLNATKGMRTITVRNIAVDKVFCGLHRTQHDVALTYNSLEPKLGDRVINLTAIGVPLGLRGTVVTIHSATQYVEVIFDEEFISGKSLQGNCSQFRGKLCPWSDLLLVSADSELRASSSSSVLTNEEIARSENAIVEDSKPSAKSTPVAAVSKSKKLLELLKKPVSDSPQTGASADAAVESEAPAAEVSEPNTVAAPVVVVPTIVSAQAASAALLSALRKSSASRNIMDKKRMKLASVLSNVRDDDGGEIDNAIQPVVESIEPAAVTSVTNTAAGPAPAEAQPTAASMEEEVAGITNSLSAVEISTKSSAKGRSKLAMAAGVDINSSAVLMPPSDALLTHQPWLTVVSYATPAHIQDLNLPPPPTLSTPVPATSTVHNKQRTGQNSGYVRNDNKLNKTNNKPQALQATKVASAHQPRPQSESKSKATENVKEVKPTVAVEQKDNKPKSIASLLRNAPRISAKSTDTKESTAAESVATATTQSESTDVSAESTAASTAAVESVEQPAVSAAVAPVADKKPKNAKKNLLANARKSLKESQQKPTTSESESVVQTN